MDGTGYALVELTIISRPQVQIEMTDRQQCACANFATIMSYPTNVNGLIVIVKTPQKSTKKIMRMFSIVTEHGIFNNVFFILCSALRLKLNDRLLVIYYS